MTDSTPFLAETCMDSGNEIQSPSGRSRFANKHKFFRPRRNIRIPYAAVPFYNRGYCRTETGHPDPTPR